VVTDIIKDLYRKEFARLVAVFSNKIGLGDIQLAEDLVGATFLEASQRWERDGIPDNPSAWLYKVALNNARQHFRRNKIYKRKLSDLAPGENTDTLPDPDFSPAAVFDSQLKMLFAVCNPAIASEAQIALALRVLCGFTIEEIARAFFTGKDTINKRLFRAKEKLRDLQLRLEMPPADQIAGRLDNVLHIIYLLFNEGYYSSSHDAILRKHLCSEALSLCGMLAANPETNTPKTNALIALICFHSSRIETRISPTNELILYDDQDSGQWDKQLISKGIQYLETAATGDELSSYHLEAGIAFFNSQPGDTGEKWLQILHHYDLLLQINYTPATVLNRIYALYKTEGAAAALKEMADLPPTNHFYYTLKGQLHEETNPEESFICYQMALNTCQTASERRIIGTKIHTLQQKTALNR
jgi:RNA polymerase sigma factor (sigma-70 family)